MCLFLLYSVQLIITKLCTKFHDPKSSSSSDILDGKKLTDGYTNIVTENAKNNIPPLYFVCRGYNGAAVANVAAVVNNAVVAVINVVEVVNVAAVAVVNVAEAAPIYVAVVAFVNVAAIAVVNIAAVEVVNVATVALIEVAELTDYLP